MRTKPLNAQGHRGARGLRPADTLASFDLALQLGVSTLEMDAEVTRDKVVVLAHDPAINPNIHSDCYGNPLVFEGEPPLIRDLTLEQIKMYDAGSRQVPRFPERVRVPGERIPRLEDLLVMVDDIGDEKVEFCLELKFNPLVEDTVPLQEFAERVLEVVQRRQLEKRFVIQCFDLAGCRIVKELAPTVRTLFLVERSHNNTLVDVNGGPSPWTDGISWKDCGESIVEFLKQAPFVDVLGAEFISLYPESEHYLGDQVADIQALDIEVAAWTVNEISDMERLIDMNLNGVMSDYPDRLLKLCREKNISVQ